MVEPYIAMLYPTSLQPTLYASARASIVLLVIWRCWQDHEAYDPARHRPYQALQNTVT